MGEGKGGAKQMGWGENVMVVIMTDVLEEETECWGVGGGGGCQGDEIREKMMIDNGDKSDGRKQQGRESEF